MISPRLYKTLPADERKLWHTHAFEVKSGMLIMPTPAGVPDSIWEPAETAEMRDVAPLYGKTYHFWHVDRGDPVPLGAPVLMGSFTCEEDVRRVRGGEDGLEQLLGERDGRFGVEFEWKARIREGIGAVEKHPGLSIHVFSLCSLLLVC